MPSEEKKPKKRGRKPKNQINDIINNKIEIKSEEEPLIAHLSINLQDILEENETENSTLVEEDSVTNASESESVFIKCESDVKVKNDIDELESDSNSEIKKLEDEMLKLKLKLLKLTKNDNIEVCKSKFNKEVKCWWCKNSFDSPSVGLPDIYFNDKFYCSGHFCSYNCALAYNIDQNDNVWKKTSLLNLLYYKTYNSNKKIIAAPNWKQLKEFGGNLSIDQFRKNSIINNNEYTLLHPPLETRLHIFEKSFKNIDTVSSSVYKKFIEDSDELVLKRSKPLKSSQYSLDKTLLIKKKKKENRKLNKLNGLQLIAD